MAKATTTAPAAGSHAADATPADGDTVMVPLPTGLRATAHGADVTIPSLPIASLVYLLLNGFSQSMTDAGTTAGAAAKKAAIKTANEARGKGREMSKADEDAFLATDAIKELVASASEDARGKRVAAIMDGSMVYGARGPNGPKKTPLEAFVWACAEADAKATAARKGKPLPKGEELATLLEAIIGKKRADYESRFTAAGGDTDLDDLM